MTDTEALQRADAAFFRAAQHPVEEVDAQEGALAGGAEPPDGVPSRWRNGRRKHCKRGEEVQPEGVFPGRASTHEHRPVSTRGFENGLAYVG
jgi:hypothetical protein